MGADKVLVCPKCPERAETPDSKGAKCSKCGFSFGKISDGSRATIKRQIRDEKEHKLADAISLSGEKVATIIKLTASEISSALEKSQFTSEEVVSAFIVACRKIGRDTDNIAEELYDEAILAARESDERRKSGKVIGPLDGVPISVKDQYFQKGADATCGMASRCFRTHAEDGIHVKLLRDQGAIPFVRSNVPQLLMVPESMNAIWGTAKNPWNVNFTPGGSSGGEGGLIAGRCSPLGLGSDIGGSIRLPAHMSGICGFRCTPRRMTLVGTGVPFGDNKSGAEGIRSCPGPMARSVDDLAMVLRAWMVPEARSVDPFLPPLNFNESMYAETKKLRIGYYVDDGYFSSASSCQRGVQEAAAALRKLGHEVVEFKPPRVEEMVQIYLSLMTADGQMKCYREGLEGEPMADAYRKNYKISKLPKSVRAAMVKVLRGSGENRLANIASVAYAKSAYELYNDIKWRNSFISDFTKAWDELKLDALICPGSGLPAFKHGACKDLVFTCCYTFMFNTLHYPAGTVPVTRVREDEQTYDYEPRDKFSKVSNKMMEGTAGLPIGVQVVSKPYEDEVAMRIMRELEREIDFKDMPEMVVEFIKEQEAKA